MIQVIFVNTGLHPMASKMSAASPLLCFQYQPRHSIPGYQKRRRGVMCVYGGVRGVQVVRRKEEGGGWARRGGGLRVIQFFLSLLSLVLMFRTINQFYSLIL